jgi:hypothetical protein
VYQPCWGKIIEREWGEENRLDEFIDTQDVRKSERRLGNTTWRSQFKVKDAQTTKYSISLFRRWSAAINTPLPSLIAPRLTHPSSSNLVLKIIDSVAAFSCSRLIFTAQKSWSSAAPVNTNLEAAAE